MSSRGLLSTSPLPTILVYIFVCEQGPIDPQLSLDAYVGSATNFTISPNYVPGFPNATLNTSYCIRIVTEASQTPIWITLEVDMLPLQICYSCSRLESANKLIINTNLMPITYQLKDNWNNTFIPTQPIAILTNGEVVGYVTNDGVSLINVKPKLWLPISRVHFYVSQELTSSFFAISIYWVITVSAIFIVAVLFFSGKTLYFYVKNRIKERKKIMKLIQAQSNQIEKMKKVWEINAEEIKWEEFLNQGGFGEVWKCQWHDTTVAVKKLLLHWVTSSESSKQDFDREVTFLRSVRHQNIVLFYGAGSLEDGTPFLVTEFVPRGSLFSILKKEPNSLSWKQKLSVMQDVAKGMQFLHANDPPCIHRDLKPQNLLVTSNFRIKIADFGTAKLMVREKRKKSIPHDLNEMENLSAHGQNFDMTARVGTIKYMAPELFFSQGLKGSYGKQVDVFSYGITMWVIAKGNGEEPYASMNPSRAIEHVQAGGRPSMDGEDVEVWPESWVTLMRACWESAPEKRLSFDEIVSELLFIELDDE